MSENTSLENLLSRHLKSRISQENQLKHLLPLVYSATEGGLKAIVKKMMDANLKAIAILETLAIEIPIDKEQMRTGDSAIDVFLNETESILNKDKEESLGSLKLIPLLQKIIHQQMAETKILLSHSNEAEIHNASEGLSDILKEERNFLEDLDLELKKAHKN